MPLQGITSAERHESDAERHEFDVERLFGATGAAIAEITLHEAI